jgi:hypothetical protein
VDDNTVHQYVQEYKRLNKLRRAPSMRTMTNFPSDPAEFTATYPTAYGADGPVPCPYDTITCDSARASTAARKSHRTIASGTSLSSTSSTAMGHPQLNIDTFTAAFMRHMGGFHPQQQPRRAHPEIQLFPPASVLPVPEPQQPFALENGPIGQPLSPETPKLQHKSSMNTLDDALAEVAASAAVKKARGPAAPATEKPTPLAMKRPAAAPAADGGRASVTVLKSRMCVVARTGVRGDGMTKSIAYKTSPTKAKAEATEWLREKCSELGIECKY